MIKHMRFAIYGLAIFALGYLSTISMRPLLNPDEFRYGLLAKETATTWNIWSPRLLGLKYYEKPGPAHVFNAVSVSMFGENAFALRFMPMLFTFLTSVVIYGTVYERRRDHKLAALAGGLHLTFVMVYAVGTTCVLDAQLTFFITASVAAAFLAACEERFTKRKLFLYVMCGIALTCGTLTKGFLAVALPGLSVLVWIAVSKKWKELWRTGIPILAMYVACMAVPAYMIHKSDPAFWSYFIHEEHLRRFLQAGVTQHAKPWYFYIPILIFGTFPGLMLLPSSLAIGKAGWRSLLSRPLYSFALCAMIVPLVVLSCASGKLPTYILCCYPPAAVLMAGAMMKNLRESLEHRVFDISLQIWANLQLFGGALAVVFAVALPVVADELQGWPIDKDFINELLSLKMLIGTIGAVCMLAGLLLVAVGRKLRKTAVILIFMLCFAAVAATVNVCLPENLNNNKMPELTLRKFRSLISNFEKDRPHMFVLPSQMMSAAWIFERPDIRFMCGAGELDYGDEAAQEEGKHTRIADKSEVADLIKSRRNHKVIVIWWGDEPCPMDEFGLKPELSEKDDRLAIYVF